MWNVTSLVGKEPELGQKWSGTNYIVGLTSKHSPGPEAKTLERGWTLSLSSIKSRAGVGILASPSQRRGSPLCDYELLRGRVTGLLKVSGRGPGKDTA